MKKLANEEDDSSDDRYARQTVSTEATVQFVATSLDKLKESWGERLNNF